MTEHDQKQESGAGAANPDSPNRAGAAQTKGKSGFLRWLNGHFVILVRLALACGLTICVAIPLAYTLKDRLGADMLSAIPPSVSKTVTNRNVEETQIAQDQKPVQENQLGTKGREESETTSATPWVSTYGIQIASLLAALVCTLWAIVALSRVE